MAAFDRGARQSTLVSEMRWAARVYGDAVRDFLFGCFSVSRLILLKSRDPR
jgi:hypothetical protein